MELETHQNLSRPANSSVEVQLQELLQVAASGMSVGEN